MSARGRLLLLGLWLAVLGGLLGYVQTRLRVSTDLRSFMPPAATPGQRLLLDEIGEGPGSRLLLLALSGDTPQSLAATSRRLAAALREDTRFLRALNGEAALDGALTELLPYRYLLSPGLDGRRLDADTLRDALMERVEDLASPAAGWIKPLLPRDPTLETLVLAQAWAPAREPQRIDEVWFDHTGSSALLLVETRAPGFDPQAQRAALDALDEHFRAAAAGSSARLEASGPGAFAVRINDTTAGEANRIGVVDSLAFFLLLLLAYRRLSSVLLGALPLLSGGLAGMAALGLVFGGAHGITLAFGFTLIGVAQDYPIHLFSHLRPGTPPLATARALWPTLSTGLASTVIAYAAFFASGVSGLQQLALFTVVGLAVAGASTRWLLPRLIVAAPRDAAQSAWLARLWERVATLPRPRWLPALLTVLALGVLWAAPGPFWENNLAALTPVPEALLRRDGELRAELGAPDVRYLLVLEGADAEAVLQASERLGSALAPLRERGSLAGYELPSTWLPSLATQRARQAALPQAAPLRAALDAALADLPFQPDTFAPFLADVEAARALPPLDPARFLDGPLGLRLKAMLLPRDGHWTGLVTLSGVNDVAALAQLAARPDLGVTLLDLKQASESLVAAYRQRVLWSLAAAAVLLVGVVVLALRRRERVLRVLLPMALTTLLILAALRGAGVALSLFHLIALILAAGLGLDYALFFEHAEDDPAEQRRTLHALLVCSASTFLVFLLLALSALPVLRAIGLPVTLGVALNFLLALLWTRRREVPRAS